MQGFTQKYTIIQLFEDVADGIQFPMSSWPLHATIVDTFAIEWDVPEMIKELGEMLAVCKSASSVVEDDMFFGPKKQTQVALLRKTDDLIELHYKVVELLEKGGLKLNDPQFSREGFLPHSTVQKHARLHKDDEITFGALTIIDMFPGEDPYQRKVLKTIKIGAST